MDRLEQAAHPAEQHNRTLKPSPTSKNPCCDNAKPRLREDGPSPTFEQLAKFYDRVPVLIYEQVKTAQYLRFFKRYRRKLLFLGRMMVSGVVMMGLSGHTYLMNTKYDSAIHEGLMSLLSMARLDDESYKVIDWVKKGNRLIVLVSKEFGN